MANESDNIIMLRTKHIINTMRSIIISINSDKCIPHTHTGQKMYLVFSSAIITSFIYKLSACLILVKYNVSVYLFVFICA